jgi:hypothetical protein
MKIAAFFLTTAFVSALAAAQETQKTGDAACPL